MSTEAEIASGVKQAAAEGVQDLASGVSRMGSEQLNRMESGRCSSCQHPYGEACKP